ncbi:hypothetical protein H6G17_28215 [Chroococcidiopsis sp. FACHB-1243]|jgi:hypothetical protein|uniref:hypothetical protein n=1 Tax=Chroococcidiopsis sp. [FACHB-1243] TaxID=2692781 RepID=UPI000D05ACB8|nr:hypothetical protein [Chroococcidiopsis sp. [FACHB-1243]]MBD2309343.1 hypothetical protein [Chroococcidiopsis sp. [FACHB-1243]]PSB48562.1 hypothetical protein C7B80_05795 [Cyanosarcina cf. burmensis CCALA 770]
MKRFVIGTALVLAIPALSFANASLGSAADAEISNRSNTGDCKSIPPARPTGGGTRERIAAIKKCDAARASEQQMPSTSPTEQPSSPSEVPTQQNQEPDSSEQPSAPGSVTIPSTTP